MLGEDPVQAFITGGIKAGAGWASYIDGVLTEATTAITLVEALALVALLSMQRCCRRRK